MQAADIPRLRDAMGGIPKASMGHVVLDEPADDSVSVGDTLWVGGKLVTVVVIGYGRRVLVVVKRDGRG